MCITVYVVIDVTVVVVFMDHGYRCLILTNNSHAQSYCWIDMTARDTSTDVDCKRYRQRVTKVDAQESRHFAIVPWRDVQCLNRD